MSDPSSTVIVVEFHTPGAARDLARSVLDYGGTQVVVVRNDCSDLQPLLPENALYSEVRNRSNLGFAAAFNQGAAKAKSDTLISLNCDVGLTAEGLNRLVEVSRSYPSHVIAPALVSGGQVDYGRLFYSAATLILARFPGQRARLLRKPGDPSPFWVLGACFAISGTFWRLLQGFDARFFLYFEDVDLCLRAWHIGSGVMVLEDLVLAHGHGRASTRLGAPLRYHLMSALRFFHKHRELLLTTRRLRRVEDGGTAQR